jgi:hypothetical protein
MEYELNLCFIDGEIYSTSVIYGDECFYDLNEDGSFSK